MHSLQLLLIGVGLVRAIAIAPAEAGLDQLLAREVDLGEAYDRDDPAIKDLPEIDPSEIIFTDYDAEVKSTPADEQGVTARGLTHHFCGMDNYPHPTIGPIRDGISYLLDGGNQKFCVAKKKCGRISCSYGTGMNVCNGKQKEQCYTLHGIGKKVDYLAHHVCHLDTDCTTGPFCGLSTCCSKQSRAFQGFYTGNFNVIVRGGFNC